MMKDRTFWFPQHKEPWRFLSRGHFTERNGISFIRIKLLIFIHLKSFFDITLQLHYIIPYHPIQISYVNMKENKFY